MRATIGGRYPSKPTRPSPATHLRCRLPLALPPLFRTLPSLFLIPTHAPFVLPQTPEHRSPLYALLDCTEWIMTQSLDHEAYVSGWYVSGLACRACCASELYATVQCPIMRHRRVLFKRNMWRRLVLLVTRIGVTGLGLYKIMVYVEACVHKSILLFANSPCVWTPPSPPLIAHPIAQYIISLEPPLYCNACHMKLVIAISCKGQHGAPILFARKEAHPPPPLPVSATTTLTLTPGPVAGRLRADSGNVYE